MTDQRVLITGSAGVVGTLMRPRLRREGRVLRLLDLAPQTASDASEEIVTASVTDAAAMACGVRRRRRADPPRRAQPRELVGSDPRRQHQRHADGAGGGARRRGVAGDPGVEQPRGGLPPDDSDLPADSSPRPDTYYGVSKAAIEALGSLYHSRFGMDVIVIRIGSCFETPLPLGPRGLTTWLSPDDGARLFEACLSAPSPGYRLIWGVSDNTRRIYSLAEAEALGYKSQDDAEVYAEQLAAKPAPAGISGRVRRRPVLHRPPGRLQPALTGQ